MGTTIDQSRHTLQPKRIRLHLMSGVLMEAHMFVCTYSQEYAQFILVFVAKRSYCNLLGRD